MARQATPRLLALETTTAMRAVVAVAAGAVVALTLLACMTASAAAMPRAQLITAPALLERWSTRYSTFLLTLSLSHIASSVKVVLVSAWL